MESGITANSLAGIHFVNATTGWAVGSGGVILKSTDGGVTWVAQTSGTAEDLDNVHFVSTTVGWAVGDMGTILATTDGGTNWAAQVSGTVSNLHGLYAFDANTAWASSAANLVVATTDGGTNWVTQNSMVGATLNGMYFVDANTGWAVGNGGAITATTDGGTNWATQTSGTANGLIGVYFASADSGWAVGASGEIINTADGGANWATQTSGTVQNLRDVAFINTTTGWAVGLSGTVLTTTDGGANWASQTSGTTTALLGVSFLDATTGWASGALGELITFQYFNNLTAVLLGNNTTSATTVRDTIQFTTPVALGATDEIVLEFPTGFTFTSPAVDAGQSSTPNAQIPSVESSASNVVVLNAGGAITAGAFSIVLTGVNNPTSALDADTIKVRARLDGGGDPVIYADTSPVTFDIVGSLTLAAANTPIAANALASTARIGGTAVPLTTFKITAAGENANVSQIQVTPTFTGMATGDISNLDIYLDIDGNGAINGADSSVATPADDAGSGTPVNLTVGIVDTAGVAFNYIVTADIASNVEKLETLKIDVGAASTITATGAISGSAPTKSGNAITGFTHTVTIPVINLATAAFNDSAVSAGNDTLTLTFTTNAAMIANDTLKFEFPKGFSFTNPAVDASTVTQGVDPSVASSSDSTLRLLVGGPIPGGSQSLVLRGINNPSTAVSNGSIDIVALRAGVRDTLDLVDLSPGTFNIVGTLTLSAADNPIILNALAGLATAGDTNVVLTTFKLTAAGENSAITQIDVTPNFISVVGADINTIDIYYDTNGDGILDGGETSIANATIDENGTGVTRSIAVTETVPIGSRNYLVVAGFTQNLADGDSMRIDVNAVANIVATGAVTSVSPVKSGSAITGFYHKATPPVINILAVTLENPAFGDTGKITIDFTTNQDVTNVGDEFVFIFPPELDISGISLNSGTATIEGPGFNPVINASESSGDTVVLDVIATVSKGRHKFIFNNIINPDSVKNNLEIDISTRLDNDVELDGDDLTPARFDIVGKLTLSTFSAVSGNTLKNLFDVGGTNIPVASFTLFAEGEAQNMLTFSVKPLFTGITGVQLTKIDIFEDTNGNRKIDGGESSITNGLGNDNGSNKVVSLNVSGYQLALDSTKFIITVNLADSIGVTDKLRMDIRPPSTITGNGSVTGSAPVKFGSSILGVQHEVKGVEILHLPDTSTVEGKKVKLDLEILTTESGVPAYSGINLPKHAGIDAQSGVFSWTPDLTQAGAYNIILQSQVSASIDRDTLSIVVNATNSQTDLIQADSAFVNPGANDTIRVGAGGVYNGHQVIIPAGSLPTSRTIIIKKPDLSILTAAQVDSFPSATQFEVVGSPGGFTFDDSILITIEYKPFEVIENENNMRIHVWDQVLGIWKRVRGNFTLDTVNDLIQVTTDHFSVFSVQEVTDTSSAVVIGKGWNMVSVPVSPEDISDPVSLFSDDISPFQFEDNNSNIYTYVESGDEWVIPSEVQNGDGYILFGFGAVNVDIEGLQESADITRSLSFTNSNGWHLLGNPYAVNINWDSDVTLDPGIDNVYYRFTGTEYQFYPGGGLTAEIGAWEGFFVHTTIDAEDFTITFPGFSKKAEKAEPEIDWRIRIFAESGITRDTHNYVGTGKHASAAYDVSDRYELVPLDEEFISAFFAHGDWETNPANYTQDIRLPEEGTMSWTMNVMTNSSHDRVTLRWDIPSEVDAEYDVVLTNIASGEKIDMRENSLYEYENTGTLKKSENLTWVLQGDPTDMTRLAKATDANIENFIITVGKELIDDPNPVPVDFYLNQNYPNPFNPETNIEFGLPETGNVTLRVYNVLGQEIRTLVNAELHSGIHTIKWDGKNNQGVRVSSGVYIYRLRAANKTQIKKMILVR